MDLIKGINKISQIAPINHKTIYINTNFSEMLFKLKLFALQLSEIDEYLYKTYITLYSA